MTGRKMLLRKSTIFLMLTSAVIWATVPFLFAIGAEGSDPLIYTALFNGLGGVLACIVFLIYSRRNATWRVIPALFTYVRSSAGRRAIVLDGGGIAISNTAFVYALSFQGDATVTLIVESWPLLAAFLLTGIVARFQGLTRRQVLWSLIALVGFYFLVAARGAPLFSNLPLAALIASVISALTQAVAVAAHQRALQDLSAEFKLAKNFILQSIRMFLASSICLAVALPLGQVLHVTADLWLPSSLLALAIMSSALLYALSLQESKDAVVTLMWFLTPVISIALLAVAGLADLTSNVFVGATLVISANIFLQEKLEATVNVTALTASSVGVGTIILYTRGFQVADYFNYVQIVSAFYGILQGFLLTRLWDRRMRVGVLEEKWALQGRPHLAVGTTRIIPSLTLLSDEQAENTVRDAAEMNVLRQEMRSYSEAILLTILGSASGIVLVVGRSNTFLGDVLAFLIPVAIIYLLTVTWALLRQGTFKSLAVISSDVKLADAITSYVLVLLIFAVMLIAIGVNK